MLHTLEKILPRKGFTIFYRGAMAGSVLFDGKISAFGQERFLTLWRQDSCVEFALEWESRPEIRGTCLIRPGAWPEILLVYMDHTDSHWLPRILWAVEHMLATSEPCDTLVPPPGEKIYER